VIYRNAFAEIENIVTRVRATFKFL